MGMLHEVLPVKEELKGTRKKVLAETKVTFDKKAAHFVGVEKVYAPFDDAAKEHEGETVRKELDTTVRAKLDYLFGHMVRYWDATAQVDATNQVAKADVVIDGQVLLHDVPATTLLALEAELKDLRGLFDEIPTLAPGKRYEKDATLGDHVWRQVDPETSYRTAKAIQHKVLSEATQHHPAQIEKWSETVNVGRYTTTSWFGLMSTPEKSGMLGRIDALSRAVKSARQRANATTVVDKHIGAAISAYVLDGQLS